MIDYAIGIPLVVGQVEAIKGFVPSRWHQYALPLASVAFGILWAFTLNGASSTASRIAGGVTLGLAAIGSFDGVRAIREKKPPTVPTP